ncbi:hypothetical protein EUTSA_v10016014mg [Eutrema salsugineum]|uniref:BTB domain-containing protein n=2 Tax=Eutrema salsugineum TaxID=72664 RepID=V4LTX3_EUTSA|nr:hypothetical protein EUTSA_v10016014mg [Eutrema salsugineum]
MTCPRYIPHNAGICKKCWDVKTEAERELLEELNVLKAKSDFLHLSSINHENNSKSFTDVVLIASDAEAVTPPIHAHKIVLVSRSPVFKAMLENEMEESHRSIIKINEVSYEVLQNFVNYLYTAEAIVDEQMACDLLIMSEKYQVAYLKRQCEKFLASKLSLEKYLKFYVLAHQHNAKHLLDAALTKIITNMDMVTKREEYKELVKSDPHLVLNIHETYFSLYVAETSTRSTV